MSKHYETHIAGQVHKQTINSIYFYLFFIIINIDFNFVLCCLFDGKKSEVPPKIEGRVGRQSSGVREVMATPDLDFRKISIHHLKKKRYLHAMELKHIGCVGITKNYCLLYRQTK